MISGSSKSSEFNIGYSLHTFKPAVHQYAIEMVKPANKPVSRIFMAFVVTNLFLSLPILVLTFMKSDPSIPPKTPNTKAP